MTVHAPAKIVNSIFDHDLQRRFEKSIVVDDVQIPTVTATSRFFEKNSFTPEQQDYFFSIINKIVKIKFNAHSEDKGFEEARQEVSEALMEEFNSAEWQKYFCTKELV